jgi:hypothetical protein
MPSAGQLVATNNQRSIPQQSGDEGSSFHNIEPNKESLKVRQPTAKELAAAKAARIRLGYEQAEDEAGADAMVRKKMEQGICLWCRGLALHKM